MGLAANQARLNTLLSRMNDLELRCMQLSNNQIVNSIKSSNLSITYNKKLQEANQIAAEEVITNSNTLTGSSSITSNTLKYNKNGTYVDFNYNMLKELGFDIAPVGSEVTEAADENGVKYNYESNDAIEKAKSDAQALIEGILNGTIEIYKGGYPATLDEVGLKNVQVVEGTENWSETSFTKSLDYSARDAARTEAENWYKQETSKLERDDKVNDLKLKSANTEYQAASTEYESVKSLISNNTERGFSIWS